MLPACLELNGSEKGNNTVMRKNGFEVRCEISKKEEGAEGRRREEEGGLQKASGRQYN